MTRKPWGHTPRHCAVCGEVGPRCYTHQGWMHKRCMMPDERREYEAKLKASYVRGEASRTKI